MTDYVNTVPDSDKTKFVTTFLIERDFIRKSKKSYLFCTKL